MNSLPLYWKAEPEDIGSALSGILKGSVRTLGKSAGGRDIMLAEYGCKRQLNRTANYNSACGAGNPVYYADKSGQKPCVLLVGGVHGGEFEGVMALGNLLRLIETGKDWADRSYSFMQPLLSGVTDKLNLLIVPCINPDGCGRVARKAMVGETMETLREDTQGTWKDGSLCGWPGCKRVHPIKESAGKLGGYFNDDGINLMHDNFFNPMAKETALLLSLAEEYAPDFTILLHGGSNCVNQILPPAYTTARVKEKIHEFDLRMEKKCREHGLKYLCNSSDTGEAAWPPPSFNLISALHHVCGGISVTYESNQGLCADGPRCSYDEIYLHHLLLFEELYEFVTEKGAEL